MLFPFLLVALFNLPTYSSFTSICQLLHLRFFFLFLFFFLPLFFFVVFFLRRRFFVLSFFVFFLLQVWVIFVLPLDLFFCLLLRLLRNRVAVFLLFSFVFFFDVILFSFITFTILTMLTFFNKSIWSYVWLFYKEQDLCYPLSVFDYCTIVHFSSLCTLAQPYQGNKAIVTFKKDFSPKVYEIYGTYSIPIRHRSRYIHWSHCIPTMIQHSARCHMYTCCPHKHRKK